VITRYVFSPIKYILVNLEVHNQFLEVHNQFCTYGYFAESCWMIQTQEWHITLQCFF